MKIKNIDIHAHINFSAFDEDREAVIENTYKNGVTFFNVGTDRKTSEEVFNLAQKYPFLYAVIGLHPIHANPLEEEGRHSPGEDFDYDFYLNLATNGKVVAIGECGLDYFHITEQSGDYKEKQKKVFEEQIKLALEVDKPVMIHCRDAYDETLEILEKFQEQSGGKLKGNFHFFAGTKDQAKRILDLGFNMSFTGVVTFAPQYKELVEYVPIDRMHAETDSPYVAPAPYRGQRNEPLYVLEVVSKIAEIKGLSMTEVSEQLNKNANKLFGVEI